MKEFFPRKAILPSVLCLLPIGAGLLLYSRLPEQVVTHWSASGEPNGYSSRFAAVFIIPGILFWQFVHFSDLSIKIILMLIICVPLAAVALIGYNRESPTFPPAACPQFSRRCHTGGQS